MLAWSASFVAQGGTLLFATCTIAHEENQMVVEEFLQSAGGQAFELVAIEQDELTPIFKDSLTHEGYFSALPQSAGPDGHFAARLRKKA
jgi:16S rRNA (cytosine967-C5)-methyltransferase